MVRHPISAILLSSAAVCGLVSAASALPMFRGSAATYATGAEPVDVAAGDLDADGRPDLVVAHHNGQSVAVLLANPVTGFALAQDIALPVAADFARIVDVDADGRPDILGGAASNLFYLRGRGDGQFELQQIYDTGLLGHPAAVADLDGDGWADVVLGDSPSGVRVFWGRGNGTYDPSPLQPVAQTCGALVVTDADTDGRLDVVSAGSPGTMVSILFGNGSRTFRAQRYDLDTAVHAVQLAAADLDHDGDADLLTLGFDEHANVQVLRGTGGGRFTAEPPVPAASYPYSMAVADLDGDGALDLAVAKRYSNPGVQLLFGSGTTFVPGPLLPALGGLQAVAAPDLNGDGRSDLVATCFENGRILVWLGQGSGRFPGVDRASWGTGFKALVLADFNRDSRPDAVFAHGYDSTVELRLGRGDAAFGAPDTMQTGLKTWALAAADLDADGNTDLVTASAGLSTAHPVATVRLGNGDGTFEPGVDYRSAELPSAVLLADFNRDSILDLAVASAGRSVSVLLGQGGGRFGFKTDFPTAGGAYSIAAADLDHDGDLDLVTGSERAISVLRGQGDGTFSQPLDYFTWATYTSFVRLVDVDGDGDPDAICTGPDGFGTVLGGRGDGTFAEPGMQFPVAGRALDVVVADLDQDGRLDLAVAGSEGTTVLAGDGAGGWETAVQSADYARGIAGGDLDGDGRPDLLLVTENGEASVLMNTSGDTPVWIEAFSAQRTPAGVRLEWQTRAGAAALRVQVERAGDPAGPYEPVAGLVPDACAHCEFEDTGAPAGAELFYRLVLADASGVHAVAGPITVGGANRPQTRLEIPRLNRGRRAVVLQYSIADPGARTRLAVVDVRGRLLWSTAPRMLTPGTYLETWDARAAGAAVAPGVYFVRLESGARTWARKLALHGF